MITGLAHQNHQTTNMIARIVIAVFAALVVLSACNSNRVYEKNIEIPDAIWHKDSTAFFKVDITDTVSAHNFYINIRHSGAYQFSNIYLFVNTTFPSGKHFRDTVECILADQRGKWLGDGIGDIWDNQVLFKKDVRFPESGEYIFEYEQAMRAGNQASMEMLPFVMDVGLKIEKQ